MHQHHMKNATHHRASPCPWESKAISACCAAMMTDPLLVPTGVTDESVDIPVDDLDPSEAAGQGLERRDSDHVFAGDAPPLWGETLPARTPAAAGLDLPAIILPSRVRPHIR
jgi:hypothetical protein